MGCYLRFDLADFFWGFGRRPGDNVGARSVVSVCLDWDSAVFGRGGGGRPRAEKHGRQPLRLVS